MVLRVLIGVALGVALAAPAAWALTRRAARRALDRAREAEDRVRNSERMAYVGELAAGLAHEIKNPLSTLSVNLQLLAEDWAGVETDGAVKRRVNRKIELLQRETERLTGVLDDFLRFARGGDLNLVETDLNEVLEDVLLFFQPEARQSKVELRCLLQPVPAVRLDADAMKQAVLNILVNAQQAMPDGGEMIVRTTLNVSGAVIEVVDTGCGIPSENNDKVFRPYFSTKRGGTGLGLPTARRIVEEHGGRIAFDSEVGKGTCFRILLPLAPQATPPEDCPEEA